MASSTATARQLILILDTTASMRPVMKLLRESYIEPLIRTVVDQSAHKKEKVELAMILFRDYQPYANYLVQMTSFTRDKQLFLSWLDQVELNEGGYSHNALGEALAAALQLSNEKNVKEKHFVLVTSSAPHGTCNRYYGADIGTAYDQAALLGKMGICLSIIAPHQIKELEEIFNKAAWSEAPVSIVEKKASTHLVLLRGLKIATPAPAVTTSNPQTAPSSAGTGLSPPVMPTSMPTAVPMTSGMNVRGSTAPMPDARKANVLKPLMPTGVKNEPVGAMPSVMAPMAIPPSAGVPLMSPSASVQPVSHMNMPNIRPVGPGMKPGPVPARVAPMAPAGPQKATTVINLTNSAGAIHTPSGIAKPVMPPGNTIIQSKSYNQTAMWEGTLAWHPHLPPQSGGTAPGIATLCNMAAYPHRSRMQDPSVYGVTEWPRQLVVTGVTPSKEAIQTHHKSALIVNFEPNLRQMGTVNNSQQTYQLFINQLVTNSWAAVINIGPKKTLLIIPHKQKLLGLLLPKLALNPRGSAAPTMPRQPAGGVPSGMPMTTTSVGQGNPTAMSMGGISMVGTPPPAMPLAPLQPGMFPTVPASSTTTAGATTLQPTATPMSMTNFVPSGGAPSASGMSNPFRQQFMPPMTATAPPTGTISFDNMSNLAPGGNMNTNAFINLGGMPMHHRKT